MSQRPHKPIPLSAPDLDETDRDAVLEVLQGRHLSRGPFIEAFERRVAETAGRQEGVAVSSGTAALHLAAILSGLKPGDEVLTTPFSFIASANIILYLGATPVFVEIDPETLNMDVDALESRITPRTRAIVAVHAFGRPHKIGRLEASARRHDLILIEDACEAIGGECDGRPLGGFGDFSSFAFYPNKQVTCGEGGVLLTDHGSAARRARGLRNQGRDPDGPGYLELGFNYRMTDFQAALATSQLQRLPSILERRRQIADGYRRRLEHLNEWVLPVGDPGSSWFVYVVRLHDDLPLNSRDAILSGLTDRGIGCGRYFEPIHLQPFYRQQFGFSEGDFPITERIAARTIALPFFNRITEEQLDRVAEALAELTPRLSDLPGGTA
ncbi:MAG: DegT/DnrJ/EryC1/StrS family aminotransferase [Acidobacteriota bacterium]|nr:DegT/DnrJ/EryC1/StrS family aminotransferase [Acidobacteriota bacterium]MDH3785236.1 DegT/DnrJ/EryC1/StrS family aminotransferase [Acidobacteriota bacterium]